MIVSSMCNLQHVVRMLLASIFVTNSLATLEVYTLSLMKIKLFQDMISP